MQRFTLIAALALGALGYTACDAGINSALDENPDQPQPLTAADRQEIIDLMEESPFFEEEFGGGLSAAPSPGLALSASGAQVEVEPTPVWARFRGRPVNADDGVTVELDEETGLALATKSLEFDGELRLDITDDGALNPTAKPLREILLHQAAFERLDEPVVDDQGRERHWRLVSLSPAQLVMTDEAARTVRITGVTIELNGEVVADLADPVPLLDVDGGIPVLAAGDELTVTAMVENDNDANTPPTFVYLYLFQGTRQAGTWLRILMDEVELEDGGVAFTHTLTVEQPVERGRIIVDALDSQTFVTESEDDYRANVWAVPHTTPPAAP